MHLSEVEVSNTAGDHLKHEDTRAQQGHFVRHVDHMLRFKRLDQPLSMMLACIYIKTYGRGYEWGGLTGGG
jgi:hypothetical protein